MATLSPSSAVSITSIPALGSFTEYHFNDSAMQLSSSDGAVVQPAVYRPDSGGGGGGTVDGYTLRSGDRLLVIDALGNVVGLAPAS